VPCLRHPQFRIRPFSRRHLMKYRVRPLPPCVPSPGGKNWVLMTPVSLLKVSRRYSYLSTINCPSVSLSFPSRCPTTMFDPLSAYLSYGIPSLDPSLFPPCRQSKIVFFPSPRNPLRPWIARFFAHRLSLSESPRFQHPHSPLQVSPADPFLFLVVYPSLLFSLFFPISTFLYKGFKSSSFSSSKSVLLF